MDKIRPSPTNSATLYKTGTIKTGNDGNKWIITENKNGVKRWKLYKKPTKIQSEKTIKKTSKKTTKKTSKKASKKIQKDESKEETWVDLGTFYGVKILSQKQLDKIAESDDDSRDVYIILKTKILPEINKLGIETFFVPLPFSKYDIRWSDFPPDYIKKIFNKDILDFDFMYFRFDLDKQAKNIDSPSIHVEYSPLDLDKKIKIIDIFEKYLFGYFQWTGSNHKAINIDFYPTKNPKHIDKKKLKQDDTYPILSINLDSNINLIKDQATLHNKLVDFFENLDKKYLPIWSAGISDFEFSIYAFDTKDTKYIEKIKKHIKSLKFVTKCEIGLYSDPKSKEKILWNYKN